MRLLVIHTHPVQYVSPQLRYLNHHVSLKVIFICQQNVAKPDNYESADPDPGFGQSICWDLPILDGYESCFITNRGLQGIEGWRGLLLLPTLTLAVIRSSPDAVLLFNHSPLIISLLGIILPLLGFPLYLRTEANDKVRPRRPFVISFLRETILRCIYSQAKKLFPISGEGRRHLETRGVPPEKICTVNYSSDSHWLEDQKTQWLPQAKHLRTGLGIPQNAPVLLYAGRYAPEKGLLLIPDALALLSSDELSPLHFISVGGGPLHSEWTRRMKALLGKRFHNIGFLNQAEIGKAYALADALLLPSVESETWGLVANEALAFGCQAFLSDRVGSADDLKDLGNPVTIFNSGQPKSLVTALQSWLATSHEQKSSLFIDLPHSHDFPSELIAVLKQNHH